MDNGEALKVSPEVTEAENAKLEQERRKAEKLALKVKKAEKAKKKAEERRARKRKKEESEEGDKKLSENELREEWYKAFTEEELANQDTRSTIESAIKLGYRPSQVTSKGEVKQTAEEVFARAKLEKKERLEEAETLLKQLAEKTKETEYKPLTEEQEDAIIKAHEVKGKGVFEYEREEIAEKVRILRGAGFTKEQTRMLIEAGIAGKPIDAKAITDASLKLQMKILNKSLEPIPENDVISQVSELEKALNRIGTVAGVDADQADTLVDRIMERLTPLKQQEAELKSEARQGRHEKEYAHEFVKKREGETPGDLDNLDINNFSADDRTRGVATRVIEKVNQGGADNDFLRNTINELYDIQQNLEANEGTAQGARALDETSKLRGMLQRTKSLINGREVEENMKSGVSQSLYGEIRLTQEEKESHIEDILKGHEQTIDEHFNERFSTADTQTGDDWREALGQAAQLEVEDFRRALTMYASGREAFQGRLLTNEEQDKLDKVGRRLSAEVKLRQNLHDVTYYVNKNFGIEDILKVIKTFSVEDADMAYSIKGVPEIGHFFEQAMYEVMLRHGGHLPAEAMMNKIHGEFGEVEELVRAHIKNAIDIGVLDWDFVKDRWEINRAVSMARGMGIVTGRTIEIVAGAGIPPEKDGGVLVGWWANNIIKKIAFFRQISRYNVGEEGNRFMAYKLENPTRFWHTKELSEISGLNAPELLHNWFNENNDSRWGDMLNPGQVGSVFYQTGWRYGEERITHTGAIVHLLGDNPFNPLIGVGMWIEKQRRNLSSTDDLSPQAKEEIFNYFGVNINTVAEKAQLIISKNLDLSAKIGPLKLFHNLVGLKQQVLRGYYSGSIEDETEEIIDKKTKDRIIQNTGRITIKKDSDLRADLETLAVVQESLVKKRTDLYKKYLKEKEANPGSGLRPPDLYSIDADINVEIDRLIAENKIDPNDPVKNRDKGERIKAFVKHVNDEFTTAPAGDLSQKDKLISNLKDKGWKIPFIFGTDDLPYDLYNFTATGSNGFERRWGDINSVAQAATLFETLVRDLPDIPDQDTLIGKMKEIYKAMAGHDEGRTREFMVRFTEGMIKFYKKDIIKRIPLGFGTFDGLVNGKASYAQIAWGRGQMAWDEPDCRRFVYEAWSHGLIREKTMEELKKKTGAEGWIMGLAIARSAIPLGLLGFLYYMFTAEMEGLGKAA